MSTQESERPTHQKVPDGFASVAANSYVTERETLVVTSLSNPRQWIESDTWLDAEDYEADAVPH